MGTLHKSWARNCVYNFLPASRKQRGPSAGEDFHWVRAARVQAGLPHVRKEPGTSTMATWSNIDHMYSHTFLKAIWICGDADGRAFPFARFPPADWHVCRFRHHDGQVAGWDHSAYPALQPHHRQDQVSRSALIPCNTHITDSPDSDWLFEAKSETDAVISLSSVPFGQQMAAETAPWYFGSAWAP